ncbi:MAG: diguanylate cyclase [Desulforhopalus sp.]|jgi:diguanylate cyclase (GGDEF)-like protein|nr:diguanylate cyclase [Desulforhopalus sp.]
MRPMMVNDSISLSDLRRRTVRQELAGALFPQVLWLLFDEPPAAEGVGAARLVVTENLTEHLSLLPGGSELVQHIPVLLLGTSTSPPQLSMPGEPHRLIDYLTMPTTTALFRHRLHLLSRIQQISAENQTYTDTISLQLNALYSRDSLTGLLNRHQLTQKLPVAFARALNRQEDLALLLVNIDYFNSINKAMGLSFGDLILNEMAARLTQSVAATVTCYRFSSEDFIVLLPDTDHQSAQSVAEQLNRACTGKPFSDGLRSKRITVSMGLATLRTHHPSDHEQLLAMAETALFAAKAEGRNRISSYLPLATEGNPPGDGKHFLKDNLNRIFEKTRSSTISSLELLARSVAGPEYQAHVDSISSYANLLGEHLGLPEHHLQTFHNSIALYSSLRFLLHNDLIAKPGALTERERHIVEGLPYKISELTDIFHYFQEEKQVIENHTEHYDGRGYPRGLEAEEIPLGARIFNIVKSLAAMTGKRPHRQPLPPSEILQELTKQAGKQFDPMLVWHMISVIEKNTLLEVPTQLIDRIRCDLLASFPELSP